MPAARPDFAREVRAHLTDPVRLVTLLQLGKAAQRQASGVLIRCPVHVEKTPSCSVTRGPDGTIRVRCFGCDFTGDALSLIAVVFDLDIRSDFREVLVEACRLWGLHTLEADILDGRRSPERPVPAPAPPPPPRTFPPADEVRAVWDSAVSPLKDAAAADYLRSRGISPQKAGRAKLLRVLPEGVELPRWARYRGEPWTRTGHRLLARLWGHDGQLVSLRAWRFTDGDSPKRLPPAGHRCSGHVLANKPAVAMLLGKWKPRRIVVAEGEPDHVVFSLRWSKDVVLGIGSGWWTPEIAARVPQGCRVIAWVDQDEAGQRYAAAIAQSLGDRAEVVQRRWS